MTELNRPPRKNMSRPYTPLTGPISATDAEQDAEPLYADAPAAPPPPPTPAIDRAYAQRVYTVRALSPQGFPVELAFSDIALDQFQKHLTKLAELGYTPPK